MSETAKERLYSKLNEVKTNHDKALNVYGTQTMNEVLEIVDSYFENLPVSADKISYEKLQEQLNTAKKALTEIASPTKAIWLEGVLVALEATQDAKIASDALAAIGGDDD